MKKLLLILFVLTLQMSSAQIFKTEVLEGQEFIDKGNLNFYVKHNASREQTSFYYNLAFPLSTPFPKAEGKTIDRLAVYLKVYNDDNTFYERWNDHSMKTEGLYSCSNSAYSSKKIEKEVIVEIKVKFTSFAKNEGYGDDILTAKFKVTPIYFSKELSADKKFNFRLTHRLQGYDFEYYPGHGTSVRIYVNQGGTETMKPVGVNNKDFKYHLKYIDKRTKEVLWQKKFVNNTVKSGHKDDPFYMEIGYYKQMILKNNRVLNPGSSEINVLGEVTYKDSVIYEIDEDIVVSVPKFNPVTVKIDKIIINENGKKLFDKNNRWNNRGRDPIPDLYCEVKLGDIEWGQTSKSENTYESSPRREIRVYERDDMPNSIEFKVYDADGFLNADDLLFKKSMPLKDIPGKKEITLEDPDVGSVTISFPGN